MVTVITATSELRDLARSWDEIVREDGIDAARADYRSRAIYLRDVGEDAPDMYPDGTPIEGLACL